MINLNEYGNEKKKKKTRTMIQNYSNENPLLIVLSAATMTVKL